MGYRVHRTEDSYKVVEVVDGEVSDIITDLEEETAKLISHNLNRGGGFNGPVPLFFHDRIPLSDK